MLTDYHRIIPERLEVLKEIAQHPLFNKELTISFAKRNLPTGYIVINPDAGKTLMITAGCHGTEPAPVYACKLFMESIKDPRIKIVMVPCINPFGFCLQLNNNKNDCNINRDLCKEQAQIETALLKKLVQEHKPKFVINMHEDPDQERCYLYIERDTTRASARKIIEACGIEHYKEKLLDGKYSIREGIISDRIPNESFEDYLTEQGIPNICTETPGMMTLQTRIQANLRILRTVLYIHNN